jgi:hypothetical protein
MGAHFVPQPLVRTTILLTPEQKAALAADSAESGKPMGQLIRDLVDREYFDAPATVRGFQIRASLTRPVDSTDAPPPPRARLREWISRSSGLGQMRRHRSFEPPPERP